MIANLAQAVLFMQLPILALPSRCTAAGEAVECRSRSSCSAAQTPGVCFTSPQEFLITRDVQRCPYPVVVWDVVLEWHKHGHWMCRDDTKSGQCSKLLMALIYIPAGTHRCHPLGLSIGQVGCYHHPLRHTEHTVVCTRPVHVAAKLVCLTYCSQRCTSPQAKRMCSM
jgi:hypothetical protein